MIMNSLTLDELQSVCRFCLNQAIEMRPIFRHETADDVKLLADDGKVAITSNEDIVEMISICLGLETTYTDGLPMYLCTKCHQQLKTSFEFRKKCILTVENLRNAFQKNNVIKSEYSINMGDTIYITDGTTINDTLPIEYIKVECVDDDHDDDESAGNGKFSAMGKQENPLDRPKSVQTKKDEYNRKVKHKKESKANKKCDNDDGPLLIKVRKNRKLKSDKSDNNNGNKESDAEQIQMKKARAKSRNRPEQCDICGFIAKSLKSHMLKHTQERNYECDFCGKKFSLRVTLKNHIFAHINIRPFKCNLCHQTFITSCKRKNHMITHTGERNYSCPVCDKKFAQPGPRDVHLLTHSQMRQHKCEYCGKLFLLKHQLRNHIGIHTGERSYECGLCPMTFINSSGVSSHRRIHKEKNEYRCEICQMKIKELRFLKIHVKEHSTRLLVKPVIAHTDPQPEQGCSLISQPIYGEYTMKTNHSVGFDANVPIIAGDLLITDIVKNSLS